MAYSIRQIFEPTIWEAFVRSQLYTVFVQSSHYADFYASMGEKTWIFGVYDDANKLVGGSLVVSVSAKRGNFLFLPYGPIGLYDGKLFHELKRLAQSEGYHFIRVSPFLDDTKNHQEEFKRFGFHHAPMHILAETTWLLDIGDEEDDLLQLMNKNHRNLIRRCLKEGVRVELSTHASALQRFNDLLDTTTARHRFQRFSRTYIEKEFFAFARKGEALILEGYLPNGTLESSAIVMYYGKMACYRHGASLGQEKRLPASYAVQWSAIREAKRRGMRWYNFWGIAPPRSTPRHPFYGITHFKKGFGGFEKQLLHCQDLPTSSRYWLSWTIETVRRLKRGF